MKKMMMSERTERRRTGGGKYDAMICVHLTLLPFCISVCLLLSIFVLVSSFIVDRVLLCSCSVLPLLLLVNERGVLCSVLFSFVPLVVLDLALVLLFVVLQVFALLLLLFLFFMLVVVLLLLARLCRVVVVLSLYC